MLTREYLGYSPMKKAAASLYIQTKMLNKAVDEICLGEGSCGKCLGDNCIIGYTKSMLKNARDKEEYYMEELMDFSKLTNKDFPKEKVIEALSLIVVDYIEYGIVEDERFIINQVRRSLELILFGRNIEFNGNLSKYIKNIEKANNYIGNHLKDSIERRLSDNS